MKNNFETQIRDFSLNTDGPALLQTWCDGLLAHRVMHGTDRGGFLCPSMRRVPGRSVDAIQPLMALYRFTKKDLYRQAAIDLFEWGERNTSQPDGSWINEKDVPWKGITAFTIIALGETLRFDEELLTPAVRERWRCRLASGADYLVKNMTFDTGDINYPLSTAASLAVAAVVLNDKTLLSHARAFAHFVQDHQTVGGLIWGEGARGPGDISPRGLRAIDISYNVEETLPNLALYAELTGDSDIQQLVIESLKAHLHFLLPDGGWDAGWSSRQYKWCYWGSATCDGAFTALHALRKHHHTFAEAAARNLALLRRCTHDGLIYAGPGLHGSGHQPLLHHTFVRAKALAATLNLGMEDLPSTSIESDRFNTVRRWTEAGIVQFGRGDWRGTATVNDIPQSDKRGGQPSGGALTLLWHRLVGPVCVASMNDYVLYEPANMQALTVADHVDCLTPRIECRINKQIFSNLYDRAAQLETLDRDGLITIRVHGTLQDRFGQHLPGNEGVFQIIYRVTTQMFSISGSTMALGATLICPVVSQTGKVFRRKMNNLIEIQNNGAEMLATTDREFSSDGLDRPIFNFVPGVEAVRLQVEMPVNAAVTIQLKINCKMDSAC